jgi:mRNA interferase YafQ
VRRLVWDASFRRAFKRVTRRAPELAERVFDVVAVLAEDPFNPRLKTHRLRGQLDGLWACWVAYDCRIVFALEPDPATGEDVIVLADIGSHDEVY